MDSEGQPTIGELSRQVQGVLVRVESVVSKLESQYVRNDIYLLWQQSMDERVKQLEDDKKWLVRLVLGIVIASVITLSYTLSGGGK
jgi:hypothetical protein